MAAWKELKEKIIFFKVRQQQNQVTNQEYEERVKRAEEKWSNSEKKLEKIRDLLGTEQINKLKRLYKEGSI